MSQENVEIVLAVVRDAFNRDPTLEETCWPSSS